jgi:hypothetical protein
MACFCRQCTEDDGMPGGNYDEGRGDMQGLVTDAQWAGGFAGNDICEGCAGGEFDPDGYCCGDCLNGNHHSPREA